MDACQAWRKCMEQYLVQLYHRSQSQNTLDQYHRTLRAFFSEYPKYPDQITRADVETFLERPSASWRNKGCAPSTATRNQRIAVLSSFYSYAATYTITGEDGNPVPLLQRPAPTIGMRRGHPARSYRALSFEELQRFFSCIPRDTVLGLRDRAIFLVYFWTARRRNEILYLRWGDIERGVIVEKDGSRREGWLYRFTNKGHATQEDVAELPRLAKLAIDEYLLASGRMATMTAESYVFTDTRNLAHRKGKPMGIDVVTKAIKKYATLAGLPAERVTIHSLRHSAARERYSAGEDIRSIQRLLRHSDLGITDRYLSILMGTADHGARLLEERFGGL